MRKKLALIILSFSAGLLVLMIFINQKPQINKVVNDMTAQVISNNTDILKDVPEENTETETGVVVPSESYISITQSEDDLDTETIDTNIFSYDLHTKTLKKVFQFKYTTQYPLGYYDAKSNVVFYTKRLVVDEVHGDQIFMTDLNTTKETQLTTDIFAVNYIISDNDMVYFVGRPLNSQVLKLGVIDLKTKEVSYWGDENIGIESITLDRKENKIIASAYYESDRVYSVTHQDGPAGQDNFIMPTHRVYEIDYDFSNYIEIIEEPMWIRAVMVYGDDIYALCDKKYNNADEPSLLYRYNRNDKLIYTSTWDTFRLQRGDAGYSNDGEHIFSLSTKDDKRGIYDFNLITGEVTPIMIQTEGFINNMQVVNY